MLSENREVLKDTYCIIQLTEYYVKCYTIKKVLAEIVEETTAMLRL